jgi:hypothetical protein
MDMQNDSRAFPLALACAALAEDTPLQESTGTPGIDYGMSKNQVLKILVRRDEIRKVGTHHILTAGVWELLGSPSLKTFEFIDGALSSISYAPLPEA